MAANLKFVFLIIFQMCCCCIQGFDLKGDIKFEGEDVPKRFPPGSYLIVKVEDNSLADAPSKVLARIENPINSKDFQKKKTLSYKISVKEPGKDVKRVSVSIFMLLCSLTCCNTQLLVGGISW